MTRQNAPLGIALMIVASLVFAAQDGISRHLATNYNVLTVVMIRYWFFAGFVVALSAAHGGGVARVPGPRSCRCRSFGASCWRQRSA
jgi:hypothetical protein